MASHELGPYWTPRSGRTCKRHHQSHLGRYRVMALNVEFRHGPRELRSLQEWEQRLFIPARTLLHHASQGKLKLFVRPPFMAAVEYALFRVDEAAGPLTREPF